MHLILVMVASCGFWGYMIAYLHARNAPNQKQTKPTQYKNSFRLPDAPSPSVDDEPADGPQEILLRYGYRNNVCPSREVGRGGRKGCSWGCVCVRAFDR